jgi:hypothetical protein
MTIDTEKLRALLAAATPGPWRKWAQHESTRCVWKDTLPPGSTCIESTGTVFALGVAVAATPDDGPDAALIAAAVNALPELLDFVDQARPVMTWVCNISFQSGTPVEDVVPSMHHLAFAYIDRIQALRKDVEMLGSKLGEKSQALATAEATIKACDDVLTVEFCLPWHKKPLPERVRRAQRNAIDEWQAEEAAHKATREKLATAEAERLTLARALVLDGDELHDCDESGCTAASEMARRIVAEADAAKVAKETT